MNNTKQTEQYITFNELINDLAKWVEEDCKDLPQKTKDFVNDFEWCTCTVMQGLVDMYKVIKANGAREALRLSEVKVGRPKDEDRLKEAVKMYKDGVRPISKILKATGIGKSTLYKNIPRYIDEV